MMTNDMMFDISSLLAGSISSKKGLLVLFIEGG
jgi:hypothetical protein